MATQHKGSPSSAPSSAPESGTVRDESDNDAPAGQHQRPRKQQPGQQDQQQDKKSKGQQS
jgi:hypothetical protein